MTKPSDVVDEKTWLAARQELMAKEKELTRAREEVAEARRALPWMKVQDYALTGRDGKQRLSDLFQGRSQLIIYHFMFGPDWKAGCKSCSFWADHFDGMTIHLAQRDVSFAAVSRGPIDKLEAFKKRLGWKFPWVSSADTSFNHDFAVSFSEAEVKSGEPLYNNGTIAAFGQEMPGLSVFYEGEDGTLYRTYSTYARGLDMLNATYHHLDLVPKGRDEERLKFTMDWVKIRDEYPQSA